MILRVSLSAPPRTCSPLLVTALLLNPPDIPLTQAVVVLATPEEIGMRLVTLVDRLLLLTNALRTTPGRPTTALPFLVFTLGVARHRHRGVVCIYVCNMRMGCCLRVLGSGFLICRFTGWVRVRRCGP